MTTPAFVSAGPRILSGAAGATNLYDAGRTYTSISTTTHANFAAIPSGQSIAVLTGANAGLWLGTGTNTITAVSDWSAVVDGDVLTADSWRVDEGGTSAGFSPPHTFQWAFGAWALASLPTWPTTMEIPVGAAPAGVSLGDRVLLVTMSAQDEPNNWRQTGGLDDWEFVGSHTAFPLGTYYQLRCYSRRWASGCLPVTIEPQTGTGTIYSPVGTQYFYCAQLFAFTPSYGIGPDHDGDSANTGDSTLDCNLVTSGGDNGIAIAFGAQPWANDTSELGGFTLDRGFTEVHRTAARSAAYPSWRGGELAMATRNLVQPEGSVVGPTWVHPTSAFVGTSLMFTLEVADPNPVGGLRLGKTHMNAGRGLS